MGLKEPHRDSYCRGIHGHDDILGAQAQEGAFAEETGEETTQWSEERDRRPGVLHVPRCVDEVSGAGSREEGICRLRDGVFDRGRFPGAARSEARPAATLG